VASTKCTTGACAVDQCSGPYFDIDKTYPNGCECADDNFGKDCGSATGLGTLALTASTQRSGVIPSSGGENWFVVTFAYTTATSYHPSISLTSAAGNTFVFDLYTSCSLGTLACGSEGGLSTARTSWDVIGGGASNGVGCTGLGTCTSAYSATPSVGTVFIKVRRASGAPTCGGYTLTVAN